MLAQLRRRWLEKATLTTADFTGGTDGGFLSNGQATKFLRVATDAGAILPRARMEMHRQPKFEVPRISLHGVRLLQVGAEATRLADAVRKKPVTKLVTLSTNLYKAEIPISEETWEDQIEGEGLADTIATMVAEAIGRDIEEISIKSDTARVAGDNDPSSDENTLWDQFDGLIKQLQTETASTSREYDGTGVSDPETIFKNLVEKMPARYRTNPSQLAIYVPVALGDAYVDALSARGTALGDTVLQDGSLRPFRGIPVVPVQLLSGTGTINSGAVNYGQFAFCTYQKNVLIGYHRKVRFKRWGDEREGAESFLVSTRFDCKFAEPEALTFAKALNQF